MTQSNRQPSSIASDHCFFRLKILLYNQSNWHKSIYHDTCLIHCVRVFGCLYLLDAGCWCHCNCFACAREGAQPPCAVRVACPTLLTHNTRHRYWQDIVPLLYTYLGYWHLSRVVCVRRLFYCFRHGCWRLFSVFQTVSAGQWAIAQFYETQEIN